MPTPKRDTRLLFITFLALFLLLGSTYAGRLARKAQLDREIVRWETKNVQAQEHQQALAAELRFVRSDAYVEQLAYEEFSMTRDNEQLLAVVPVAAPVTEAAQVAEVEVTESSPWQAWFAWLGLR